MSSGSLPAHLLLLTQSYPFGTGEDFLADELDVVAGLVELVTIVAEEASGPARSLPPNCRAVSVRAGDLPPRITALPKAAWRVLAGDAQGASGPREHVRRLRGAVSYGRHAAAVVRAARRGLAGSGPAPTPCFYACWMDHKALAAVELRRTLPGSAAICRAHGFDVYAERHPDHHLPLRGVISRGLDAVFAISDDGARELGRRLPAGTRIITSRLGVPPMAAAAAARSPSGGNLVISIGSLSPVKRIELLVDALAGCAAHSGFAWRHMGDGPLRTALEARAFSVLKIPYAFGGHVPNSQLRQMLATEAARAVLVSTSASEGIPVSMMEAMAHGIPCIGTRVGGVAEIIRDGVNGYLLPANPKPEEVRGALESYVALPDAARARMGQAALDTWSRDYDSRRNYAAFVSRIAEIIRPG